MYLFVAIFFGLFAFIMIGAGLWVLFFTDQVSVSFLRRLIFLGPWLTTLKAKLGLELREYYLKNWAKNLLGLFLLIAGLAILYAIWLYANAGLVVF